MRHAVTLMACLLAAVCLLAGGPTGCGRSDRPDPGRKLLVLGIDSADWDLLEPMIAEGRLPNLEAFRRQAASGRLLTFRPLQKSPVLWASIVTGLRPSVHGVGDFVRGSKQMPVRSSAWRAPALWDIAGAAGRRSAVIGMWTTYPARDIPGVMVSDYLPYGGHREQPLRGLAAPDSLSDTFARLQQRPEQIALAELGRFIPPERLAEAERLEPEKIADLRAIWAADRSYLEVARLLAKREDFDLFLFYLRGPDMISHEFWPYLKPEGSGRALSAEAVACFGQVVPRYYDWVDEVVGEVLSWFPPDRQVVILSDHGFHGPRLRGSSYALGTEEHSPFGIFLARSPRYEAGSTFDRLELLDAAPTMLALLGLPPSREMPGKILEAGLTGDGQRLVARLQKDAVESYQGLTPQAIAGGEADTVVDDQIRRQLRSLGYIQ